MDALDVLRDMGVTDDMVVKINGTIADMPNGYEVQKRDIVTGRMLQIISIYPNQSWTDGSCRPVYGIGGWDCEKFNVRAYLNTRI